MYIIWLKLKTRKSLSYLTLDYSVQLRNLGCDLFKDIAWLYFPLFEKERCPDSSDLVTSMNHTESKCFFMTVKDSAMCFSRQTIHFCLAFLLILIMLCLALWLSIVSLRHLAKSKVNLENPIFNFSLCDSRKKIIINYIIN